MKNTPTIKVTGIIKLGQFIKLSNMAYDGAQAKELIQNGYVTVNNTPVTQRGYQLKNKDTVCVKLGEEKLCTQVEQAEE